MVAYSTYQTQIKLHRWYCRKLWCQKRLDIKNQLLVLVKENLLVVLLWQHTEADPWLIPEQNSTGLQKTPVLMCLIGSWMCLIIFQSPLRTLNQYFLLCCDQAGFSFCVITELPASFLWPAPRFDSLCMGAFNARPHNLLWSFRDHEDHKAVNTIETTRDDWWPPAELCCLWVWTH